MANGLFGLPWLRTYQVRVRIRAIVRVRVRTYQVRVRLAVASHLPG